MEEAALGDHNKKKRKSLNRLTAKSVAVVKRSLTMVVSPSRRMSKVHTRKPIAKKDS